LLSFRVAGHTIQLTQVVAKPMWRFNAPWVDEIDSDEQYYDASEYLN
jgi:hypothetical protein